jgi:yeast amino acid transporter
MMIPTYWVLLLLVLRALPPLPMCVARLLSLLLSPPNSLTVLYPQVIAMQRMSIPALPSIVNALILSSVLSAGNAFVFCSSRSLAMMARDGQAPSECPLLFQECTKHRQLSSVFQTEIFSRRNKRGVPYIAVSLCLAIALFSYLQVSSSASVFITYLTGLVGSAQLVTWFGMSFTWIRWKAAYKAQGISRDTLPSRVSLRRWSFRLQ